MTKKQITVLTALGVLVSVSAVAFFHFNIESSKNVDSVRDEERARQERIDKIDQLIGREKSPQDIVEPVSGEVLEKERMADPYTEMVLNDSNIIENSDGYTKYENPEMGFSFEYPSGFDLDLKQTIKMWGEDKIEDSYYSFISPDSNGYIMAVSIQGNNYQKDTEGIFHPICTLPKTSPIKCEKRSNIYGETYYFAAYEGMPDNFDRYEFPLNVGASFVIEYGVSDITPAQRKAYEHMIDTFKVLNDSSKTQSLDGIQFRAPKNWNERKTSSELGFTYLSSTYLEAKVGDNFGEDLNGIQAGAALSFSYDPEPPLADSLKNAKKYAEFEFELMKNCSNCEQYKMTTIDGVPAIFGVSFAGDHGGTAAYEFYDTGHLYKVALSFADKYKLYEDVLDEFVDSIDFNR